MSEEDEIHYVYTTQEFVLGQEEVNPELGDFVCSEGSRAILVDGQYIVADNQTILLQGNDNTNLTQYYINDSNQSFVVDDETSVNDLFESSECVQLVEEETNDVPQIIYYSNDEFSTPVDESIEGIQDEDGNIYPLKRIKLEGQMLNFEEFMEQQKPESDENSFEYTILDEDNSTENPPENEIIDLSKITGRNLITGQTVTLHSYMEKLKKRLDKTSPTKKSTKKQEPKTDNNKKPELTDLLDKKISIGKTKSGKKIVGKIIHVEKKQKIEPKIDDQTKILIKKCTLSTESFEQISKTLGGVMEMESVRKKLENKNIVVKLVEKKYMSETDSYNKSTSFCYGYMHLDDNDETGEKWKFVSDETTRDILLGIKDENDAISKEKSMKFQITTSLTILINYEKGGTKVRVNLNPAPGILCTICAHSFKSNLQLRQHMHQVHNTFASTFLCEICDQSFDDIQKLHQHRNLHIQEGKLFVCSKCNKTFTSHSKLQKHEATHDNQLLKCMVCDVQCSNKFTLRKHLIAHSGMKAYICDICNKQFATKYDVSVHKKTHFPEKLFACNVCTRTFSRHSNLLRHSEIHKGTGALYKCEVCCCSYNYMSSLTRHMVQNHLEGVEK